MAVVESSVKVSYQRRVILRTLSELYIDNIHLNTCCFTSIFRLLENPLQLGDQYK